MKILEHASLEHFTTFGVQVSAKYLVSLSQPGDIQLLLEHPLWQTEPHFILGGGSNILFTDDFDGIVVVNQILRKKIIYEDSSEIHVELGGGEGWHDVVMWSVEQGLWGIENLALIPGTVGAAPVQNIGAYGVEIESSILSVSGMNLETKQPFTFNREECQFAYRNSIFKKYPGTYCISSVTLALSKQGIPHIEYANLRAFLPHHDVKKLTPRDMAEAVIQVRRSKLPEVGSIGTAGSFFKNPIISLEHLNNLQKKYPTIPFFDIGEDKVKIPAGWLIETLGYKGVQEGKVGTYEKHALVLVNYGGASGKEVWDFAQKIMRGVFEHFSIHLEPEVLVYPSQVSQKKAL